MRYSIDWEEELPMITVADLSLFEIPQEHQLRIIDQPVLPEGTTIANPPVVVVDDELVEEVEVPEEQLSDLLMPIESEQDVPIGPLALAPVLPMASMSDSLTAEAKTHPQFPGGESAFNRFLFYNIKYPASAVSQHQQGRVWCSFFVNSDGSVSDIQLEQGVFIALDQEAIRVLKTMPAWIPAQVNDKAVRTKVFVPVVFRL
jgi:protein TonB